MVSCYTPNSFFNSLNKLNCYFIFCIDSNILSLWRIGSHLWCLCVLLAVFMNCSFLLKNSLWKFLGTWIWIIFLQRRCAFISDNCLKTQAIQDPLSYILGLMVRSHTDVYLDQKCAWGPSHILRENSTYSCQPVLNLDSDLFDDVFYVTFFSSSSFTWQV